ncbi:PKD domain-containing protein [Phaeodactylibacter xiamenensis]|uniref:PKD domain-containing protein n=1 Tax=Phaeodactylibacter xiamenensis TaxID=1524460 RepID=UPI003CCC39CA
MSNTLDNCQAAQYRWRVNFLGAECHSDAGVFEYISNTDSMSLDPAFRFTRSGVYEVTLVVTNDCGDSEYTETVTVGELPQVELDPIADFCDVASFIPTFNAINCELPIDAYLWDFATSNNMPTSSNDANPGTINYGVGTHIIELSVTNLCGTTTDANTFVVLQGPGVDLNLSKDFVCLGDTISVINNSTGDNLSYFWSVEPNDVTISNPTDSMPIFDFTNAGIGDYQIFVSIGNAVCDTIDQAFDVRVSTFPMVSLDTIPDDCEVINIDPVFDYGIPNEFIDSVLWKITNSAGDIVYSSMALDPGVINIMGDDDYRIMVTAYNRCDSSVAMDNFSVLEGPSPLFFIDTNFVCEGGMIMVTDSSGGDGLTYDWTITGPGPGEPNIQTPTSAAPTITFPMGVGIGDYTLSVELSNPVCTDVPWDTLIMVSRPPMVSLDTIPDDCEVITIDPVFDYGIPNEFIDSVLWKVTNSAGELVYTSMDLDPGTINIMGDDDYTIMVTAYNRCDSSVAMDNFSVLEGPSPLFFIDTNFVCEGGMIMVTDSSGGDGLTYDWTITGPGPGEPNIQTPTSAAPTITFPMGVGIGDYTLSVELSNPVCDGVPWDTMVMVSRPPMVSLDTIPDDCEVINIDPVFDYGIPNEFIDSVLWKVTNSAGEIVYTSMDLDPGTINIMGDDDYTIMVTAYNRCDSSVAMDNFSVLEGPSPLFFIDTNFVCEGGMIMVTDSSGGDGLTYDWTITGPGPGEPNIQTPTSAAPTITFPMGVGIGDYTLSVELSNPVCDGVPWDTMVMVSRPPMVSLDTIPDDCEVINIDPVFDYGIPNEFIDSVLWKVTNSAGEIVYTSMDLDPGTINIMGDDDYTIMVTAYNRCDSSVAMDNFSVLEGPSPLFFIDTNFVCEGGMIMVTDSSGGDGLTYDWTITGPGPGEPNIQTPTSAAPTITFPMGVGIGDYTLSVELSNPVCDGVPWDTMVMVSRPPMVSLDTIPDDCEVINIDPVFDYGIPNEFIDSVLWKVTNSAGEIVYTSMDLDPGTINIMGDDDYTIMVTAYNRCDSSVAMDNFSVLEGPSPLFFIDTNFVCEGGMIMVTDSSGGDGLTYDWTITGPGPGEPNIQTPTSAAPTITFPMGVGIGDYTLSVELSNPVCTDVPWDTMVMVSRPPMVSLDTIPDDCEVINIDPVFDYGIPNEFIDSVLWKVTNSAGELVYTSMDLDPGTINIMGDDDYTIMVTAYNRCDSSVAMDNFSILEGPSPLFFIDTNFVCEGGVIMVTDSSGGDGLLYDWTVSGPSGAIFDIQTPTSSDPVITFTEGIGDYTISVELSNPVCDAVPWDTLVMVSRPPMVSLDTIPDDCEVISIDPVFDYGIPNEFIDSVLWKVTNSAGELVYTSMDLDPGTINIMGDDDYTIMVTAYNRCDSSAAMDNFSILEGPSPLFFIDTNFVCEGGVIMVTDSSGGDGLLYDWTVSGPSGAIFDIQTPTSSDPVITFTEGIGDYTISVELSNPVCDAVPWDTLVMVSRPPMVSLDTIPDDCEVISIDPVFDYGIPNEFIDSVLWKVTNSAGELVYTSMDLDPGTINIMGDDDYTIMVTAYNRCDSSAAMDNFSILEGPSPLFFIDTNFVCEGGVIMVTDSSGGDGLLYDWTVSGPSGAIFDIQTPTSSDPVITFTEGIGDYTISVELSNPVCDAVPWDTLVMVSRPPMVSLDTIPDDCEVISIDPVFDYGIPNEFIDSVLWKVTNSAGELVYTSMDLDPGTINIMGDDDYTIMVTAYNRCDSSAAMDNFSILEGPSPLFFIDTNFVCEGGVIMVTDSSGGDGLLYDWTVSGPAGAIFDIQTPTSSDPVITFTEGIGDYTISVELSNPVCDAVPWDTLVMVSRPPMVSLDTIPDDCEVINIDPVFDYGIPNEFIDSVLWKVTNSAGELVYTSMDLDPGTINIMGDDDYTIMVTAYNRCDSSAAMDNFSILEGPSPLFFIDTNFVCEGGVIMVTDSSGGDGLLYDWTVSGPAGAIFDIQTPTSSDPVITFTEGIGDYTISVELSNPVCDAVPWDTMVMVSRPPMVSLDTVPDDCEVIAIGPVFDYGIPDVFIDSVRWKVTNSLGEMIYTSTDLYPDTIDIVGDDDYTLMVTAYNRCDSSVAMDNFSILEGPSPLFFIDTNFVCEGGMIMVTDSSGGDALLYDWIVSGPPGADIDIQAPTSAEPVVTFIEGIGDYTISVEVSNPVCDGVPWDTVITVNRPPTVSLAEIDSYCDEAVFTPVATYSDTSFIDSVRWILPFITSPVSTSTEFNPGPFTISQTGIYDVSVIVYNRCGSDTATQSFQIYEGPVLDIALDTNSVCRGDSLGVQNSSTGDSLSYIWDAPPGIEIIGDDSPNPIFVLNVPNGDYSITVTISNPACDDLMEVFMVQVIEPPTVMFEDIPDTCELADITPIPIYYEIGFIDSVDWLFPGGNPALSNQFYPESILYQGAGVYTITAEVFNACGMDSFSQSFTIDTIPEIILGSTDTLCVYDSIFQIPPAIPAGGYWTGPGIIDQDLGTFDPSGFPGGQVVTVTYNFEDGECFVSEEKDIYVSDPSYVAVDTTLGFCASDTCSLIQVGEPVSLTNGWYEGPGITDSIGVFCPQLLGGLQDTTVTITYFYREPGTDCIGSDDFTVTVYALPIPGISGIDSLCVDVPETILNTTVDGNTYEWYFSDGGFYTDINPVHTFDSTGLDTIVLIAISIEGCVDSTSAEVFISGPPVAEFEMDTTMGCAILPVTFTNTSIGYQHVNYSWEFGGGDPLMSTLEQPGTVLFDQGTTDTTYFITMVAENHCGIDSYEDSVIVFPSPLTNFMASQYSGCTPLYVAFNNTTLGEPDSFFWDLGNGLTSTDSIPPDQLYTAVGPDNEIYTVTLVAFNECGLDSMSRDILVKPDSLRAFFSVDVNEGCEPLTVEFSNTTSPDSAIVYNWFFDQNDDTSNAQDTSYTFSAQGDTITTYTVSLVVDNGCARDTFSVDIDVFPRPIVSFEAPSAVCAQDSAYFQNTSIDVNGVFWDFGDGNTSSATNPNHFYDAPGTYMVRLTAFSINTGCPNVDSMEVQVRPLPQPSLSVSPLFGCPPLTVDIENTTMDGVFFTWDFGDGNTDVGGNITDHTYTSTGMYDITLIAVDSFGCGNDTIFSSVEVYPVPEAAFDVHQVDQCGVPQEVCMLNFSVGAQGYEWAAGSFSSEENHPCFIFDEAGTYEVGLIAENVFLCSDTINGEFTVYEKPEAFFEIVSDTTCEGAPVFFDNLSSNAEFVTWYYGDGTVDTSWNGQHEYLDTGIYIVNLVAGNNSGCQDTFTMEPGLTVFPTPLAAFDFEKLDNELPTTFSFTDQSSDDVIWHSWDMGDGSFYNSPNVIHRYLSRFSKQVALTVENMYNCIDTTSAQIDLDVLTGLFVPNILEPSNQVDPEKAVFKPKGIGLEIYHIAIYARNGQLVWESTELDEEGVPQGEWDGKLAGVDLPGGVYVWKVHEARFIDGTRWDGMEDQKGKLRTSNFLILVR